MLERGGRGATIARLLRQLKGLSQFLGRHGLPALEATVGGLRDGHHVRPLLLRRPRWPPVAIDAAAAIVAARSAPHWGVGPLLHDWRGRSVGWDDLDVIGFKK